MGHRTISPWWTDSAFPAFGVPSAYPPKIGEGPMLPQQFSVAHLVKLCDMHTALSGLVCLTQMSMETSDKYRLVPMLAVAVIPVVFSASSTTLQANACKVSLLGRLVDDIYQHFIHGV